MYSLVLGGSNSWNFVKLHFSGKFKILKIDKGVNLIFCVILQISCVLFCCCFINLLFCYYVIILC